MTDIKKIPVAFELHKIGTREHFARGKFYAKFGILQKSLGKKQFLIL